MTYQITQDDYFEKQLPAKTEELRNSVTVGIERYSVASQPADDYVYTSDEEIEIQAGVTKTIEIEFSEFPVANPTAVIYTPGTTTPPAYAEITTVSYYAWGAVLEIDSTVTESIVVRAEGYLVSEQSKRRITASNSASVTEYGLREYVLPENHLIQTESMAENITDTLLAAYAGVRRDISLDWRGNPALELTDQIRAPEYKKGGIETLQDYKVIRQSFRLGRGLQVKTEGRRVVAGSTVWQDTDGAAIVWQDTDYAETVYQG